MMDIPDAPWIREAECRGMDYVHDWLYGEETENDEPIGVYDPYD